MIIVNNLYKTFRLSRRQQRERGLDFVGTSIDAVAGISFTCQPGRVFCLVGPNGGGKTTTLRSIATLLRPTSGTITVAGYDTKQQARQVRRHLGFLTGATALYDRLTPDELVQYYADLNGLDATTFRRRRDELFGLLEIDAYAGQRIAKLSTGMKQKVSIVRTLIHEPSVVVLDEPTAGLDVIASRSIRRLIHRCRDEGKTILFSTHRMSEVRLLADDLGILHRGQLLYLGSYQDFHENNTPHSLEEAFIKIVEDA